MPQKSLHLLILVLLVAAGLVAAFSPIARSSDTKINRMLSSLPVLNQEKASQKINPKLILSGLSVEKFLILMSRKAFLDMNLVIAIKDKGTLENTVELYLSDITLGEAFNLVLQLNQLKAIRFNENTLIITKKDNTAEFGIKEERVFFLTYTSPEKVVDFIKENKALSSVIRTENVIANKDQGSLMMIDTLDNVELMAHIVRLLDRKPKKVHARIPLSNINLDDFSSAVGKLPQELQDRISVDSILYSETGRSLLVYNLPENIELIKDMVSKFDLPAKQALIDISLLEVADNWNKTLGVNLANTAFTVKSLDQLLSVSRLRNWFNDGEFDPTQATINYLVNHSGGRTIANPKVRVLDEESADINIGQVINVQVQSSEFSSGQTVSTQQTTYNTQEVPVGVQLSVKPIIHNDGTVTLELTISDESIISIKSFGVDRTTRNSTTKLRVRDGETVILGGFIKNNFTWEKNPVPFLGHLPMIGKLFNYRQRTQQYSELVILITPYILDFEKRVKPEVADAASTARSLGFKKGLYTGESPAPALNPGATMGDAEKMRIEEEPSSTTTRWLETDDVKTKLMYDAQGNLVYQKSWDKVSGKEIPTPGGAAAPPATSSLAPPAPGNMDFSDLAAPMGSAAPAPPAATPAPTPAKTAAGGNEWDGLLGELDAALTNGG